MGALFGGHLAVEFASGSVPALIAFMTDKFHLGYATSGVTGTKSTGTAGCHPQIPAGAGISKRLNPL